MQIKKILALLLIHTTTLLSLCQTEQSAQQKRQRIQNQELNIKQSIGLQYGANTETLTFGLSHMIDFIVKTSIDEDIKVVVHTYWKQNNVYISSQYRDGENVRALVYQDQHRILFDVKFYVTTGFKFRAEKGKVYTMRLLDQGRISKLLAVQLSKSVCLPDDHQKAKTNKQQIDNYNLRLWNLVNQVKILSSLSEFSIVMSQKNYNSLTTYIEKYLYYLIGEAVLIIGLVAAQVRLMTRLVSEDSIV